MNSQGPELTPVLRWLSKFAGLLAVFSAVVAGMVGYRLYETQGELARLASECGPCCEQASSPAAREGALKTKPAR